MNGVDVDAMPLISRHNTKRSCSNFDSAPLCAPANGYTASHLHSALDEILDSELIPCANYFENEPGRRSAAKLLERDEAPADCSSGAAARGLRERTDRGLGIIDPDRLSR
jgi:hypothetical protein